MSNILETNRFERKILGFKEGIYKFGLNSSFLLPSLGLASGAGYALYSGNPLLGTSAALASIIPAIPFLNRYKHKVQYEQNLIPNEEYKFGKDDKGNVTKKRIEFCLQLGWEVKEHFESSLETSRDDNKIKPLLLSADKWSTHGVICGTTGSGKTVYLQYIAKQLLNQGAGFMFINGKPDIEMKKEIFALCAMVGREQDFYHLDFANPKSSMAMCIFDMTNEAVDETFKFMLGEKGEGEWGQKALNLMSSFLSLFMALKKDGLVFPYEEMENINNLQDLLALKNKYTMGFYLIDSYMVPNKLVELLKLFYKLYEQKEAKQYLDLITGQSEKETIKQDQIHSNLISSMEKLTGLSYKDLATKTNEEILALNERAYYSAGVGIDYWSDIIKKFKVDYGDILDSTTPEININDILRGHKILYVSLPGTSSKNNIGLLGKMMVAQIKSAYEKIQSSSPLEVPFTVFLDEFNSWSKGIEGFGDIISQTRSKRLAFYFLFQSSLKSIDDGKGLEGMQILGNTNNKIILKIEQLDLVKEMIEQFGKVKKLEDVEDRIQRDFSEGDKTALEKKDNVVEYDKVTQDQIKRLQAGQFFVQLGSDIYKGSSDYFIPTRYETLDNKAQIPSEKRYNKERLLTEFDDYMEHSFSVEC